MNVSESCWDDSYNISDLWEFKNISFQSVLSCGGDSKSSAPARRPSASRSNLMPLELQVAWAILFACMLIIAISGNIIVIWSIIAHRRMRTVTNYFLVNLSISDLMMAIFNCIFNFVYMINSDWMFGKMYCTFNNFVANVTVGASVFTLTGITIDRYLAIVRPLKPRMSKASAQMTIVVIWTLSFLLGSPCLFFSTTITHKPTRQRACILRWPDGDPMISTLDYVYNLLLFLVTYLVPMSSMVCCYTAMGKVLWGSKSIGELTQRQLDSVKSKRKVVRMFILIVVIFGVCWLPYHSYFIYTYHKKDIVYTAYVQHLYLAFYWLAMSNAMLNPMIYYFMNARMRAYFRQAMFSWECHCKKRVEHLDGVETPPIRRYSPSYSRSEELSGTAYEKYKARYIAKDCNNDVARNNWNTDISAGQNFGFINRPVIHDNYRDLERLKHDHTAEIQHKVRMEMRGSDFIRMGPASGKKNGRIESSRL